MLIAAVVVLSFKNVIIIGAGPAGLAAASTFSAAGYDVEVHDKRPGPPDPSSDHKHSYLLVLNPKGVQAVTQVDPDFLKKGLSLPLHACVRHSADGRVHQAFLEPTPGTALALDRSELTLQMYQSIRERHPDVRFFFRSTCVGLDLKGQSITLADISGRKQVDRYPQEGISSAVMKELPDITAVHYDEQDLSSEMKRRYDLLVAADGSNSQVRHHLALQLPHSFSFTKRPAPIVYKRFRNLPCPNGFTGKFPEGGSVLHFHGLKIPPAPPVKTADAQHLHHEQEIHNVNKSATGAGPSGWGFLSIINRLDGTCSGGLSISTQDQHTRLQGLEEYLNMLRLLPLPSSTIRMLAEQLASAPWTWAGSWVRCSQLHGPRILVIGDAAHAVSPSLGQGCNAALEDVTVIKKLLTAALARSLAAGDERASSCTDKHDEQRRPVHSRTVSLGWGSCGNEESTRAVELQQLQVETAASCENTVTNCENSATRAAAKHDDAGSSFCGVEELLSAALTRLPESFTAARLPDVHALVWLDENARAFRGQMGFFNSRFIMYCAHMYCRPFLHRLAPWLISKPALQRVWESQVSYLHIKSQLKMDGLLLMTLVAGLSFTVALRSLKPIIRSKTA
ncbi:hypothetical protein CEUSTIGMA_g13487.t1 [Chlamydomonas eustigma]|uniref:FAD-binding domain-containing protein n=1 Tax=Chlamydomonas eustigma TaxID=1157962 RepID=A0A250XST4_9CHLO|nr:hypothetical protein CEUSTIGMA_g13487.t1 [Chlamydomonas eustigma]|eukprot:GAX86073.1 hypothetical protein CEUSTIGMA_g13487.t1 [Chlamydomonas eustigma]